MYSMFIMCFIQDMFYPNLTCLQGDLVTTIIIVVACNVKFRLYAQLVNKTLRISGNGREYRNLLGIVSHNKNASFCDMQ